MPPPRIRAAVTAEAPETEPLDPDTVHDLPAELDFDGAAFVIGNCGREPPFTLDGEEMNGDVYHDAKYDIRKYAEDLLNVKSFPATARSATRSDTICPARRTSRSG